MRVTVTGGCGFIGQHLVRELLARGEMVRVLDDFSTGRPGNLPHHRNLSIVEGCVTDRAAVREGVRGAERIFHLASVVGQLNVVRRPGWSATVSRESMMNLNAVAPDVPLILFSSSAVYGLTSDGPCREDDLVGGHLAKLYDGGGEGYAFGKWSSERLAEERAPGTWLTIRPFNVVGPGQVGDYGMVMPRFIRAALEQDRLTIYGTGLQTRSFGDVHAFVRHLLALDAAWAKGRSGHQVYNIGTSVETSIVALADTIDRVLNTATRRCHMNFDDAYPGKQDVLRRRPDLRRIQDLLGPLEWPSLDSTIRSIATALRHEAPRRPALRQAGMEGAVAGDMVPG
jgi:UDP-glucose 4-epimerase